MRIAAASSLLAALLLLGPGPSNAQDFRTTVTAQLDAAARTIRDNGYRMDNDIFDRDVVVGMIAAGASAYMEVNLTAGARYFFSAACDEDCSDLDLRLFRPGSREAFEKDVETDDVPMLMFTAPVTGRYILAIDMASCGTSMCYYGFRAFKN
jgi:hypothetical protein